MELLSSVKDNLYYVEPPQNRIRAFLAEVSSVKVNLFINGKPQY